MAQMIEIQIASLMTCTAAVIAAATNQLAQPTATPPLTASLSYSSSPSRSSILEVSAPFSQTESADCWLDSPYF